MPRTARHSQPGYVWDLTSHSAWSDPFLRWHDEITRRLRETGDAALTGAGIR